MKMKIITTSLMILVLFVNINLVYSQSNQQLYTVHLNEGWNLVYGFIDPGTQLDFVGPAIGFQDELKAENIKAVYGFVPTTQKYIRAWPNPDAQEWENLDSNIDDHEFLQSSFFVYSDKSGTLYYELLANQVPVNERRLYKGWNFLGLTEDMIENSNHPDISFDDLKGSCQIEKTYLFEQVFQKWQLFDYPEMDSTLLGRGLVVKIKENCILGDGKTVPPIGPPIVPN